MSPQQALRAVFSLSATRASRSVTLWLMFMSCTSSRCSSPPVTMLLYHAQVKHRAVLQHKRAVTINQHQAADTFSFMDEDARSD